ncbi:MAG: hypothetical protein C0404_00115 [Verrucomicrobia bacterium]|nr:hypothetical protein [Verrucomicrobiota bacterium]
MKLVDTSCWVHQLRSRGDKDIRDRVNNLLLAGEAAWCPPVRLELWAGVGNEAERRILREYEQVIPELPVTDAVWQKACDLAHIGRRNGMSLPVTDLLVYACAAENGVEIEHADRHFAEMARIDRYKA